MDLRERYCIVTLYSDLPLGIHIAVLNEALLCLVLCGVHARLLRKERTVVRTDIIVSVRAFSLSNALCAS